MTDNEPLIFADCDQGSQQWRELHLGLPTASAFSLVMAGRGPRGGETKESLGRMKYLRTLAAEIVTGEVREPEWFGNRHTERGKAREDEARALYELRFGEVRRVAFVRRGECGCSPDGLVGDDRGVEIKDAVPHVQIDRLVANQLPPEYRWQVVGSLLVTGRDAWDFMSHCRGLPPLFVRIRRQQVAKELEALDAGLTAFCCERDNLVDWLRSAQLEGGPVSCWTQG